MICAALLVIKFRNDYNRTPSADEIKKKLLDQDYRNREIIPLFISYHIGRVLISTNDEKIMNSLEYIMIRHDKLIETGSNCTLPSNIEIRINVSELCYDNINKQYAKLRIVLPSLLRQNTNNDNDIKFLFHNLCLLSSESSSNN